MLLQDGYKKQKLRAHSDFYPNASVNNWAFSFLDSADIMCESKCKNLASIELYEYYLKNKKLFCTELSNQQNGFLARVA